MISSTEEDYIKAIFNITRKIKRNLVGTNQIASELKTSAASVTDMLRKLSSKELVEYEKYKGVKLSSQGTKRAVMLLRKHRLWESFLVEKLGFNWADVHDIAEQLEHIKSTELINRLDEFLGFPKFDPHGDPIPDAQGTFTLRNQHLLNTLTEGESGLLVGVKVHDKDFLSHLEEFRIKIGTKFQLKKRYDFDGSIAVEIDDEESVTLSKYIVENIYVKIL